MKLAKRFAAVALAALLSVSMLTACGGGGGGGDSGTSTASAEEKINQMVSNKSLNLTQSFINATAYTMTATMTVGTTSMDIYSAKSGNNSYEEDKYTNEKGEAIVSEYLTVNNYNYSITYTNGTSSDGWSEGTPDANSTSTSTYTNPEKGKDTYKGSQYYTEKFTITNNNSTVVLTWYFDADGNIKYMIMDSAGLTAEYAVKTFKTTCDFDFAAKKLEAEGQS